MYTVYLNRRQVGSKNPVSMIKIGPYLLHTTDKALAAEAAVALNKRAEKKALRHKGYIVIRGEKITYELGDAPEQSRLV